MKNDLSAAEVTIVKFDPAAMLSGLRRLSRVLEKEVAMLDEMDLSGINDLYNEKIELIEIIEGYKAKLAGNREILSSIPLSIREDLKNEAIKFENLVAQDLKQLDRAREVHKIIMKAVRSVLEQNMTKSTGYNNKGVINICGNGGSGTPPVSVNERI